ncbi:hypothetical protein JCM9279_000693 [Rhodotorula babjevae]
MAAQVPRAAAADLASPRFLSTTSPRIHSRRPRLPCSSTVDDWYRPRLRRSAHQEAPILPPFRGSNDPPRPALLDIRSRPTWNHPSILAYVPKMHARDPEWRKEKTSYERLAILGRALLDYTVKELLVDQVPTISARDLEGACQLLLSDDILSDLALGYDLVSKLRADPVAADVIAADHEVHASLFCAYLASVQVEYGPQAARSWIRKCFTSVVAHDYPKWRATEGALDPRKDIDTPLFHLYEFFKRYDIEPQWTVAWKGAVGDKVFKAELEFCDVRAAGSGRSVKLAKQNAAARALKVGEVPPEPAAGSSLDADYTKRLFAYAKAWTFDPPVFRLTALGHPRYEARVDVGGHEYVGRGYGRAEARRQAAKTAFETLDIDPKTLKRRERRA